MMHARRETMVGWRRPRSGRPAGWLFALLVMCFAVLPHVTFAATMMRMPMPARALRAEPLPTSATEAAEAAPCHPTSPAEHPASAKPPCCIVSCGLIAEAPVAPVLPEQIFWSTARPPVVVLAHGRSTEPAERPPRTLSPA